MQELTTKRGVAIALDWLKTVALLDTLKGHEDTEQYLEAKLKHEKLVNEVGDTTIYDIAAAKIIMKSNVN